MRGDMLYDIDDIQKLLGVGRTMAYDLVKKAYKTQDPFRVIKVGRLYRIPKKPFDEWIGGSAPQHIVCCYMVYVIAVDTECCLMIKFICQ